MKIKLKAVMFKTNLKGLGDIIQRVKEEIEFKGKIKSYSLEELVLELKKMEEGNDEIKDKKVAILLQEIEERHRIR
jgi:hypothetical protein